MRKLRSVSAIFVFPVLLVVSFLSFTTSSLAQTEGNSSAYGVSLIWTSFLFWAAA